MVFMFPEFKPVEIHDLPIFYSLLGKYPPQISEHTFTNLFMWRDYFQFRWARVDDWIVIMAADREGRPYFWGPIGGGSARDILSGCIGHLNEKNKHRGTETQRRYYFFPLCLCVSVLNLQCAAIWKRKGAI